MSLCPTDDAHTVVHQALEMGGRAEARDEELFEALRVQAGLVRQVERAMVDTVAELQRRGAFTARGMRPATALAGLLGLEPSAARQLALAADQVAPRVDLQGQELPARLPGTAAAFAAGTASLGHVQVIAHLVNGRAAQRLTPSGRAGAEEQLAAMTDQLTPTELRTWGSRLLDLLDQDGAQPDDEREPAETNELFLTRHPNGSGGRIKGRFDNAAMFDIIAALLDAKAAPLTEDDDRSLGERQAEAMAEIFGYVADHGDTTIVPATGGRRPHVTVLIRLEDLEQRAAGACLDFAGIATPAVLRQLCCDACIIPIVLDGAGQPLDVGRLTRTIPDGLRRAVAARDRGCAHPGCDRPVSWSEIHHVIAWEHGGPTALGNLVMLCRIHHREIHSSDWSVRIAPDGIPEFLPPKWICPEQRPRRKPVPNRPPRPPDPAATGYPRRRPLVPGSTALR